MYYWLSEWKSRRMSENWGPSLLFADESVEFANAAVEVMYGEGETAAAVAEGTGPEGWSFFVYQRTA